MKTVLCMCVLDGLFVGLSGKSAMAFLSSELGNVTIDTLYGKLKDKEFEVFSLAISTPIEYFENMLGRLGADNFVKEAKEFYDCNNDEDMDDWPYMAEKTTSKGYIFVVLFDNDEMM